MWEQEKQWRTIALTKLLQHKKNIRKNEKKETANSDFRKIDWNDTSMQDLNSISKTLISVEDN
jgi:hypothetical protein